MNQEELPKNAFQQWLDRIQQDSWNLELIISGFSIFGLIQAKNTLLEIHKRLKSQYFDNDSWNVFLNIFVSIGYVSVMILIAFLILHIFIRGLWIGAIGLRYVSGDIDFGSLHYNPYITQYLKKRIKSFDFYIERLEKLASIIFSYSYLLIFSLFSSIIYFTTITFLSYGSIGKAQITLSYNSFIFLIFLFLGVCSLFDFMTFGLLKKIKSKTYAKIFIFINQILSILSLSILWKPLYYNFIDNKKTRWMLWLIFPFLIGLDYIPSITNHSSELIPKEFYSDGESKLYSINLKGKSKYSFNPIFYDEEREKIKGNNWIEIMSLPSKTINEPYASLFVKLYKNDEKVIFTIDSTLMPIARMGFSIYDYQKSQYEEDYEKRREKKREKLKNEGWSQEKFNHYIINEQKRYQQNLEKILKASKEFYAIKINDTIVPKDSLQILFETGTGRKYGEEGFLIIIPMNHARIGLNELSLQKNFRDKNGSKDPADFSIPFYYVNP